MMTIERLHELFAAFTGHDVLEWVGPCSTCGSPVQVLATLTEKNIKISGGAVYEPNENEFFLKCDSCYERDKVLKDYQACEVYSRIVGYLRPTNQWNVGKLAEFKDRKAFNPPRIISKKK